MSTKEKKKKLTLKNFTGSAPSSVNKTVAKKTSDIFKSKEQPAPTVKVVKSEEVINGNIVDSPKIKTEVEKPKTAKEWAKKKIQEELFLKANKKNAIKKRDYRLTVTKALSDEEEEEIRVRSEASIKRAREKQFKKQSSDSQEETQKIVRQVKVPKVITIQELANRMAERASAVIKYLFLLLLHPIGL